MLDRLKSISKLNATDNEISTLEGIAQRGLNMVYLDLSFNKIVDVPDGVFNGSKIESKYAGCF